TSSERSSGRRNAASPPLSAGPPDASSRARSSRTGSRPSPSSPPPTQTGSTPTCEHPAYTDQLTPPISPERFFTLLKKLITLLEQREQRPDPLARLTRSVELLPGIEPGMGTIQIHGPIPEILAQWKRLDESARAVQQAQRTALREGTPIPHDPDDRARDAGRALPLGELRFALLASAG